MNDKKQSIYALTLKIIKITLRVRFPCSVCCTVKTDGQERDISGEKELLNGEATLNATYSTEIYLPVRRENIAQDRKCLLFVYLKSSSGRIPAGSLAVSLARASLQPFREISRIDKCPDKNAFIEFELKLQKVEEKRDLTTITTIEKEIRPARIENQQKNVKVVKSVSPNKSFQNKNSSYKNLMGSQAEIPSNKDITFKRHSSKREDDLRTSILENYYSSERRIGQNEKNFALEREIDNFKSKVTILESELAGKNTRFNELEKEYKQLQKKSEQLEIDVKSASSKIQYSEKANRELNNNMKQLKQKAAEEKLNFENVIKRLEIRENSCKEQIKSISQKLYSSENEKQRMVYEKNLSSNEFEGREKKLRETFKEKEKKMIEERSTLLKRIDVLEKDAEKFKEDIGEAKSKHNDSVQQILDLKLVIESIGSDKERFRAECNDLKFELTKLKNQKRILQQNLDSVSKFNEQRRNFRKQLGDKDMENSQLKDKVLTLEGQITRLRSSNQELEKISKQRSSQLKSLEREYSTLTRENNTLESDLADKDSKLSSLIDDLQLEMKRSKFYEVSIADIQQQFESKQDEIERELRQTQKYKTLLEEQIEKLNQQLENSNHQLANNMKEIEQLEQMVEEKNECIQNLESQMIQLNNMNQQWQMEKIELAEEKREIQEKYQQLHEQSQEQARELNKKLIDISQKSELSIIELERSLLETQEKLKLMASTLREKQEHLTASVESNSMLQKELQSSFADKEILIDKSQSLSQDVAHLKDALNLSKKEISDRDTVIQSLRNSIQTAQKQSNKIEKENAGLNADIRNMQNSNNTLKQSMLTDQQRVYAIFGLLFAHLKETSPKNELIHPDEQCSRRANQLLTALMEKNKDFYRSLTQKDKKINKLEEQLSILAKERDHQEDDLMAKTHHLQLFKKNTNQFSEELTLKNLTIKELNETIKQKESQIQHNSLQNNKKIMSFTFSINQKSTQISSLKQKCQEFELQAEKLSIQLANVSAQLKKLQKEKRNSENDQKSKISLIDSSLRSEVERANTLQTDRSSLEKELRQQKENLRKLMRELQSKCYQCEELQLKVEEANSIHKIKDSEVRKFKDNSSELKILFDALFHSEISYSPKDEMPFNSKLEKYLSEPGPKQGELMKQNVKIFYENYLSVMTSNLDLTKKNNFLSISSETLKSQLERIKVDNAKGQASLSAELQSCQIQLIELSKLREKENESKIQLIRAFDDQKQGMDPLRRFIEELSKMIVTFEKQKKISAFVIAPVKEQMKKIEEQLALILKNLSSILNKNKRELDLANLRMKKNQSKKTETGSSRPT